MPLFIIWSPDGALVLSSYDYEGCLYFHAFPIQLLKEAMAIFISTNIRLIRSPVEVYQ